MLRNAAMEPSVQAASVLEQHAKIFSNLERYETALFRSFTKALHEFQRLQAARTGKKSRLGGAVDIEVSDR
jgi:hypothetical protein